VRKAILISATFVLLLPVFAAAKDKPKEQKKPAAANQMVDSGSFGIFRGGRRVATETFQVKQNAGSSVTTSEIKTEDGSDVVENSELSMTAGGEIIKYLWRQTKPEKHEAVLEATDQVLVQHITLDSKEDKNAAKDIPYLLSPTVPVLDDYFFVHRELLLWRYMGYACPDMNNCKLSKTQYQIIVPRQHSSAMVSLEFTGKEKVKLKGADTELYHFLLHADEVEWSLYLNDQLNMVMVEIPSEQTEVLRD